MSDSTQSIPIEDLLVHHAWVHEVARRLVYADQDVDDVEQHAWLAALEHPPARGASLRGWLATIMRRGAARVVRETTRRRAREERTARNEAGPSAADVVARAELHERVVRAVLALGEPYRGAILLRFYEGLTPNQIADRCAVPVDTVRSRIRRGLAMLRDDLEAGRPGEWRAMLLPLACGVTGRKATTATGGTFMFTKLLMVSVGALLVLSGAVVAWITLGDSATATAAGSVPEARSEPPVRPASEPSRIKPGAAPDTGAPAQAVGPVATSPARELRVHFVAPNGDAIAVADARRRYSESEVRAMLVSEEQLESGGVRRHLETLIGESGSWRLPTALLWDEAGARSELAPPPGEWRLFVTRPGATPFLSAPCGREERAEVTVTLAETTPARRVRLVDPATRAGLPGVTVTPWYEFGDDRAFLPGLPLTTDAAGEVLLPLHDLAGPRARPPTWWAETPTLLEAIEEWRFREKDGVEVEVRRKAAAFGKAWLASGATAAGRIVVAMAKGRVAKAVVDREGNWRIDAVPWIGEPRARVALIEDFDRLGASMSGFTPEPGGATRIDLGKTANDKKGATVAGRITASGRGLDGVFFSLRSAADGSRRHIVTGADGRYALEGVEPGSYEFLVQLGDPGAIDDFTIRSQGPLQIGAESRPLDFDLPGGAIAVTVVDDETSKPIPRAVAWGSPQKGFAQQDRFDGFTWKAGWGGFCDDKGALLLRALVEGAPHDLSAGADGYLEGVQKEVLPGTAAAPTRATIRLHKKP